MASKALHVSAAVVLMLFPAPAAPHQEGPDTFWTETVQESMLTVFRDAVRASGSDRLDSIFHRSYDALCRKLVILPDGKRVGFPEYLIEWVGSLPEPVRKRLESELGTFRPKGGTRTEREATALKMFFARDADFEVDRLASEYLEEGDVHRAARLWRLLLFHRHPPEASASLVAGRLLWIARRYGLDRLEDETIRVIQERGLRGRILIGDREASLDAAKKVDGAAFVQRAATKIEQAIDEAGGPDSVPRKWDRALSIPLRLPGAKRLFNRGRSLDVEYGPPVLRELARSDEALSSEATAALFGCAVDSRHLYANLQGRLDADDSAYPWPIPNSIRLFRRENLTEPIASTDPHFFKDGTCVVTTNPGLFYFACPPVLDDRVVYAGAVSFRNKRMEYYVAGLEPRTLKILWSTLIGEGPPSPMRVLLSGDLAIALLGCGWIVGIDGRSGRVRFAIPNTDLTAGPEPLILASVVEGHAVMPAIGQGRLAIVDPLGHVSTRAATLTSSVGGLEVVLKRLRIPALLDRDLRALGPGAELIRQAARYLGSADADVQQTILDLAGNLRPQDHSIPHIRDGLRSSSETVRFWTAARLWMEGTEEVVEEIERAIRSEDAATRHWAIFIAAVSGARFKNFDLFFEACSRLAETETDTAVAAWSIRRPQPKFDAEIWKKSPNCFRLRDAVLFHPFPAEIRPWVTELLKDERTVWSRRMEFQLARMALQSEVQDVKTLAGARERAQEVEARLVYSLHLAGLGVPIKLQSPEEAWARFHGERWLKNAACKAFWNRPLPAGADLNRQSIRTLLAELARSEELKIDEEEGLARLLRGWLSCDWLDRDGEKNDAKHYAHRIRAVDSWEVPTRLSQVPKATPLETLAKNGRDAHRAQLFDRLKEEIEKISFSPSGTTVGDLLLLIGAKWNWKCGFEFDPSAKTLKIRSMTR